MRHYLLLLLIGFTLSLTSCRNDFEFEPSSGGLEFSRDTIYLDTVFSNIGSSTYTLKVYNRSNKDISIPSIRLKKGDTSRYRLMVDGNGQGNGAQPGKIFNDVELLAKDSLFIFIETTVSSTEANPDDFLYTDEIEFLSSSGTQEVNLVTLIKDAYFLYPRRNDEGLYEAVRFDSDNNAGPPVLVYGFNLEHADPINGDEYHWNNTKPYVVYGYATVPANETLVVDPGARIHFHADSGLMVRPGATLKVNGQLSADDEVLENEVIFEGDRLEPGFAEVAGQWGGVLIMSDTDNTITNLTLKNATIGLYVKAPEGDNTTSPKVNVQRTQIYNARNFGILSIYGNITAQNLAVNNCGEASVAILQGGQHSFTHCTIANYFNAFNQFPLIMNDFRETQSEVLVSNLNAQFTNCIIFGSGNYGLTLRSIGQEESVGTDFNFEFRNCLIKFTDFSNQFAGLALYNFTGPNYPNSLIARTSSVNRVEFNNPNRNNLRLKNNSAAIDLGIDAGVPQDIRNVVRTGNPDAGAYEYTAE